MCVNSSVINAMFLNQNTNRVIRCERKDIVASFFAFSVSIHCFVDAVFWLILKWNSIHLYALEVYPSHSIQHRVHISSIFRIIIWNVWKQMQSIVGFFSSCHNHAQSNIMCSSVNSSTVFVLFSSHFILQFSVFVFMSVYVLCSPLFYILRWYSIFFFLLFSNLIRNTFSDSLFTC